MIASTGSLRAIPVAVAIVAAPLIGCGGDDPGDAPDDAGPATPEAAEEGQPLSPIEERGRELFIQNCGPCHQLDAAGTTGTVGPNLDEVQADEARVLRAIRVGGRGSGTMPQNLVRGEDAEAVARFVANFGPGV